MIVRRQIFWYREVFGRMVERSANTYSHNQAILAMKYRYWSLFCDLPLKGWDGL